MLELWKNIEGFESYQISNLGRVKNSRGNLIAPRLKDTGYYDIGLYCSGKRHRLLIHRIAAIAFIENADQKKEINHKNGVKTDNRIENLEWVTRSENVSHAYRTLNILPPHKDRTGKDHPASKPVAQYSLQGILIKIHESQTAASNTSGVKKRAICACVHGQQKHAGGYKWK